MHNEQRIATLARLLADHKCWQNLGWEEMKRKWPHIPVSQWFGIIDDALRGDFKGDLKWEELRAAIIEVERSDMRNITDVIDKIKGVEGINPDLSLRLDSIRSSACFSSHEMQRSWWEELGALLSEFIPAQPKEKGWENSVVNIFCDTNLPEM